MAEAEKARSEVAELCSRLIQFDSSHPEGKTDECVAFIKEYCDRHKIHCEIHGANPIKPNLVASIPGTGDRKILWFGHLDVVPAGDYHNWRYPPYSGKITEDGFIHGRGSSDMKGTCASAMVAARILRELKEPIENSVEFWFTADEEIGGRDGAKWLAREGHLRGEVCIIGDGNGGGMEHPSVDLGCKGGMRTKVIAHGKTAHGSAPFLGENAIAKLMRVIPVVEKIRSYRLELPPEVENVLEDTLNFYAETPFLNKEQVEALRHGLRHPTVGCNMIRGGVKINVVPDYAEAEFDIRLPPGSDPLRVREEIEDSIKETGIRGLEVSIRARKVAGYYESPDLPSARQLVETVQRITGRKPIFKFLMGGTDAIGIKRFADIPCLGYGASMQGQEHMPDERNSIENLVLAAKVYAGFALLYRG